MKVGFPAGFRNGENVFNCKQTKCSYIKVISVDEFLEFHNIKFQLGKQYQTSVINIFFLLLSWTQSNQLKNRRQLKFAKEDIMLIRFFFGRGEGGCFPFVTKKSQVLIFPNFPWNARI